MAVLNDSPDCARCLGCGTLEQCDLCGSTDVENTDDKTGCEHEGATFTEVDCPDCDRTGDDPEYDADEITDESESAA